MAHEHCGICSRDDSDAPCPGCGTRFHAKCLAAARACPVCGALGDAAPVGDGDVTVPGLTGPGPAPDSGPAYFPLTTVARAGRVAHFTAGGALLELGPSQGAIELTEAQAWELTPWPSIWAWLGLMGLGSMLIEQFAITHHPGMPPGQLRREHIEPYFPALTVIVPLVLHAIRRFRRGPVHWLVRGQDGWSVQSSRPGGTALRAGEGIVHKIAPWSTPQLLLEPAADERYLVLLKIDGTRIALTPPMELRRDKDPTRRLLSRVRAAVRELGGALEIEIEETFESAGPGAGPAAPPAAEGAAAPADRDPVPLADGRSGTCQVCGTTAGAGDVACPRCEAPHHRDCWQYAGECSTYGCLPAPARATPGAVVEQPAPSAYLPGSGFLTRGARAWYSRGGDAIPLEVGEAAVQLPLVMGNRVSDTNATREAMETRTFIVVAWLFGIPTILGLALKTHGGEGWAIALFLALCCLIPVWRNSNRPPHTGLLWAVRDRDGRHWVALQYLGGWFGPPRLFYTRRRYGYRTGSGKSSKFHSMVPQSVVLERRPGRFTLRMVHEKSATTELASESFSERADAGRALAAQRALGVEIARRLGLPYRERWTLTSG